MANLVQTSPSAAVKTADAAVNADVAKFLANATMLGGAGGVLWRLAMGARNMLDDRKLPYRGAPESAPVPLQLPAEEEEESLDGTYPQLAAMDKAAGEGDTPGAFENFIKNKLLSNDNFWTRGNNATGKWGVPMTYAGIPAAAAATYGGYKLTDWLLDRRRKAELESELERAKQEYQDVSRQAIGKTAAAETDVVSAFDTLADCVVSELDAPIEKAADEGWIEKIYRDAPGMFAGGYLTYAALLSALTGAGAYKYFRGGTDKALTQEAMKRRHKQQLQTGQRAPYVTRDEKEDERGF